MKPKDLLGTGTGESAVPQMAEVHAGAKSNNPERSQSQELGMRIRGWRGEAGSRSSCGAAGQQLRMKDHSHGPGGKVGSSIHPLWSSAGEEA